MATYGKTWWGKKWLETFNNIDCDNRLPRGRTYANTGRAYNIEINGNVITARVKGSRLTPYKVEIILSKFSVAEQKLIHQAIINSPSILSGLLNKKLPTKLLDQLDAHGIRLFPQDWKAIKAKCNCPDWAMPCKHIAAVIYLICAEIDKNPFVVFDIHNCDLLEMISDFGNGKLEHVQKLLLIDDILKHTNCLSNQFDQSVLEEINLSTIPDFGERITAILSDDPPFYAKNFCNLLQLAYKHWQRYPSGRSDRYLYTKPLMYAKPQKDLSEEEIFTRKWGNPESWNAFQLVIDDRHQLVQILSDDTILLSQIWEKNPALVVRCFNI